MPEEIAPSADVAVLFVHGIGWQRPGDTLRSFVGPIGDMLQQLSVAPPLAPLPLRVTWAQLRGSARVADARWKHIAAWLRDEIRYWRRPLRGEPPLQPESTRCEVAQAETEHRQIWLLAESCWARSFPNPTGRQLGAWAIRIAPWFALFYAASTFAPALLRWQSKLSHPGGPIMKDFIRLLPHNLLLYLRLIVIAILVLLVSLLAIPTIVLSSCVPVLRWIGLAAIGLVGDSYAAIVHPSSLEKMVETIQRDIRWCLKRSPRLVVVAHSQGAMLAREALSRMHVGDRVVLVGLGSGIGLLQALRQAERNQPSMFGWLALLSVCAAVVASLAILVLMWGDAQDFLHVLGAIGRSAASLFTMHPDSANPVLEAARSSSELVRTMQSSHLFDFSRYAIFLPMYFVVLAIAYLCVKPLGFQSIPARLLSAMTYRRQQLRRWVEFASWHDPVTCGPLLKAARPYTQKSRKERAVEMRMVTNGSFLPFEHGAYRKNPVVLLRIIREINQASRKPISALGGESVRMTEIERAALHTQRLNRSRLRLQLRALEMFLAVSIVGVLWFVLN